MEHPTAEQMPSMFVINNPKSITEMSVFWVDNAGRNT